MKNKFFENFLDLTSNVSGLSGIVVHGGMLDLAVSYIQVSGWELLELILDQQVRPEKVRILYTDQFEITHPNALRLILKWGARIRRYKGLKVYHPKVYLIRDTKSSARCALVGSANLSDSGMKNGVEASILVDDYRTLKSIANWFDLMWKDGNFSEDISKAYIDKYERRWRIAASARVKLRRHKRVPAVMRPASQEPDAEDSEMLGDLCESISGQIATLCMDQAGNNIRNLTRLLSVILAFPKISVKELSELKLLGFVEERSLSDLGKSARTCRNIEALARIWCRWVRRTNEGELLLINGKIVNFRKAVSRFWKMKKEVKDYFMANIENREERTVLKAIELLCSANDAVLELSLGDFRNLAPKLANPGHLPTHVVSAIRVYNANKGSRSWRGKDRRILLSAWKESK